MYYGTTAARVVAWIITILAAFLAIIATARMWRNPAVQSHAQRVPFSLSHRALLLGIASIWVLAAILSRVHPESFTVES